MARPRVGSGGGIAALAYTLRKGREAGGILALYRRLRSNNACKTCAVGMGGQSGGMVNEGGTFPEVCKKSIQAQAGDMAGSIPERYFRRTPIAEMASLTSAGFERLGRLAFPIIAEDGDTHFRRVNWDESIQRTMEALRDCAPSQSFFYASGRSSNEAAYLLQLIARAYGTNNVHSCSYYCHAASGVALDKVFGSGTSSVVLEDLDQADLALIVGANPASNHPRLITKLINLRRRGGRVIVINPLRELGLERFRVPSDWRSMLFGSKVSDLYLQPHVGGDIALLKGILKALVEVEGVDRSFVSAHTNGWEVVETELTLCSWPDLERASGVARDEMINAARIIAASERGISMWAMGLTHHVHGVDNVLALANLALARGWLGKPGAGLLPVRGHSNVQGVGSCGVSPKLKAAFARKMESLYGFTMPVEQGQDTYSSMVAAHEGRIRVAVLLGGNLFASNPDRLWASNALRRIGLSCSITTKLNEGHVHGRGRTALLLPALARDEEDQATTQESMFNFVRLSDGGRPAVTGVMRSEVDIMASIAQGILPARVFDWSSMRSHRKLREEIAKVVPGYEALSGIEGDAGEFQIEGRTFHEPSFATSDGRARFHVTPFPEFSADEDEYSLMTLRSEGQFNTVVYEEEDLYRGNVRRDVVMMSAEDARSLALEEGDKVIVESETGSMVVVAAIAPIRAGSVAMYYPEANAIVPRRLDERSRTPAFKSVSVRMRRLDEKPAAV